MPLFTHLVTLFSILLPKSRMRNQRSETDLQISRLPSAHRSSGSAGARCVTTGGDNQLSILVSGCVEVGKHARDRFESAKTLSTLPRYLHQPRTAEADSNAHHHLRAGERNSLCGYSRYSIKTAPEEMCALYHPRCTACWHARAERTREGRQERGRKEHRVAHTVYCPVRDLSSISYARKQSTSTHPEYPRHVYPVHLAHCFSMNFGQAFRVPLHRPYVSRSRLGASCFDWLPTRFIRPSSSARIEYGTSGKAGSASSASYLLQPLQM
jgi:hypothetical protein